MDAVARFAALMSDPSVDPPLDELAFSIAAAFHPELDLREQLARLDYIATSTSMPTVDGLVRRLFWGDTALRGNEADYHDPENSMLDAVLDRQLGIPISLSVVVIEVGRRLGLHLAGVSMPGHFLVRCIELPEGDDGPDFVDAFHGGRRLDAAGCRALYESIGQDPLRWNDRWLEPVDHRTIAVRMLNNLKSIFRGRGDLGRLRSVLQLRAGVPELAAAETGELRRLAAALN
ncbi:MAG: transglutaminase-like domain-containing protein [Ilumatobacteraceae bacterium]